MTSAQLASRLSALEREVRRLKAQLVSANALGGRRWWLDQAGHFADDPVFEEIVGLGRKYRRSLVSRPRKPKR